MNERIGFITFPRLETAREVGRTLLEQHLVACVNIVPQVESMYWWQGAIEQDSEALMILKTTSDKAEALISSVNSLHPYDVPEVLLFSVTEGNPSYLAWLIQSLQAPSGEASAP